MKLLVGDFDCALIERRAQPEKRGGVFDGFPAQSLIDKVNNTSIL